jgi:hypothetical protein
VLTQVDVVQGDGSDTVVLSLPILGATPKSSLLIRKITGLNPPDPTLFIGDYSRDGGTYQGRRVGVRNPVLTLDLNPNPLLGESIDQQRKMLYKAFMDPLVDADFVKLNLHEDTGKVLYLVGFTEKFETEIFDVDTSVQISMICPDPYIRDNNETVLSSVVGWTTVPFTYTGTADTGFYTKIHVDIATSALTLDNNGKKMVINRAFDAGDEVVINTNRGSRSLTVIPVGTFVSSSILANLTPTSEWLSLSAQANTMKVYGATSAEPIASIRQLRYTQAYWGV